MDDTRSMLFFLSNLASYNRRLSSKQVSRKLIIFYVNDDELLQC